MLLICVYGPPASGKLTVARELGSRTGFPVFHNHLVVDMLTPVFGFGTLPFIELREQVWLDVLERAASEKLDGVIITFTPERTVRHRFIADLTRTMNAAGGETVFVKFTCPDEELERRMENESRSEYGKIHSLVQYRRVRDSGGFEYPRIPHTGLTIDTSTIDTSTMEPTHSAERIIQHFGLSALP